MESCSCAAAAARNVLFIGAEPNSSAGNKRACKQQKGWLPLLLLFLLSRACAHKLQANEAAKSSNANLTKRTGEQTDTSSKRGEESESEEEVERL